jgi:putative serine/threonine protein kinase
VKPAVIVPIEQLAEEPYAVVLCYPKPDRAEVQSRLNELQNLGVTAIEFSGQTAAYGIPAPILGKGYVGIVVVAHWQNKKAALKIMRADADRPDMLHEALMLQKANTVNVGPKLLGATKNLLLMQLIDGDLLPSWLKTHEDEAQVKMVLGDVLEQCFRLDQVGLDHGELSKAPKHAIIDRQGAPWIVDFETASDTRRPANVPAICHFLFTSPGEVAQNVKGTLGERNRGEVISTLKEYKADISRENFEIVMKTCLQIK